MISTKKGDLIENLPRHHPINIMSVYLTGKVTFLFQCQLNWD